MNSNATRLLRGLRMAVPALGALALTMSLAGPASASPSLVSREGSEVRFAALGGEQNNVTFSLSGGVLFVTDSGSTLTAGPGCVQVNPGTVRCGTGVTRIAAVLGDRNDVATNNTSIASDIDGGTGQDTLIGGFGADRLTDPDGWGSAPAATTFSGRAGNDTVISRNGGFDRVDCGFGFDVVIADPAGLDVVLPGSCEFVRRF